MFNWIKKNPTKVLEVFIITASVVALLFLLSLAAVGASFILVLNGYGS